MQKQFLNLYRKATKKRERIGLANESPLYYLYISNQDLESNQLSDQFTIHQKTKDKDYEIHSSTIPLNQGGDLESHIKSKQSRMGFFHIQLTRAGLTLPSTKTMYVEKLRRRSSQKLYTDKAYLKGMKKKPRFKLTLGNRVTIKNRKTVEEIRIKDPDGVAPNIGRESIRIRWESLNVTRTDTNLDYMKSQINLRLVQLSIYPGLTEKSFKDLYNPEQDIYYHFEQHSKNSQDSEYAIDIQNVFRQRFPSDHLQGSRLIKCFDIYQAMREAEVSRNSYEVMSSLINSNTDRASMDANVNGKERSKKGRWLWKKWRLEQKYMLSRSNSSEINQLSKQNSFIESSTRLPIMTEEDSKRTMIYYVELEEVKSIYIYKWITIESILRSYVERIAWPMIKEFHVLCRDTSNEIYTRLSENPKWFMNRKESDNTSYSSSEENQEIKMIELHLSQKGSLTLDELDFFQEVDETTLLYPGASTTQYFSKVQNLIRIVELDKSIESPTDKENGIELVESGQNLYNLSIKRKKIPEKKRSERYPQRTHLDVWVNRMRQLLENDHIKKLIVGIPIRSQDAKYLELGKTVSNLYFVERGDIKKR